MVSSHPRPSPSPLRLLFCYPEILTLAPQRGPGELGIWGPWGPGTVLCDVCVCSQEKGLSEAFSKFSKGPLTLKG